MGQEIVTAKEAFSGAVEQLEKMQPESAKLPEDHEKAVNLGDQFMTNLAATIRSLTGYLEAVESIGKACDRQEQEGKVAHDLLRKAGIIDNKNSDDIWAAANNVNCVSLYAERYRDSAIQPTIAALGATGVLSALQELHAKSEGHIESFATEAPDEVSDVIDWAIDDCNQAQVTI